MRKWTRRELLEDALFTSTAALLAAGAHRSASAEPLAPVARRIGPNDQIRIAVIGVRGRGMDH
ncbi:MAG TPA: gfo/Idh/MocA family oxidoreductase, partial [Armatimonadota bacterium]|nr:gfo/Idh/MocA family oxidoreductase [Armatimonadota bacterium]